MIWITLPPISDTRDGFADENITSPWYTNVNFEVEKSIEFVEISKSTALDELSSTISLDSGEMQIIVFSLTKADGETTVVPNLQTDNSLSSTEGDSTVTNVPPVTGPYAGKIEEIIVTGVNSNTTLSVSKVQSKAP
jgi:hypothetical protein